MMEVYRVKARRSTAFSWPCATLRGRIRFSLMNLVARYTRWLHTRWPAGHVEKLPRTREDGSTNIPGMYVVGDLRGIPLLKFSSDTGARAVQRIVADPAFQAERGKGTPRWISPSLAGASREWRPLSRRASMASFSRV